MGAGVALVVGVKVVVMVENREAAEAVPAEAVPAEAVPAEAAAAEAVEGTEQGTARFEVGVGPWEGPWPEGDHWDEELLREGDRRNVVDSTVTGRWTRLLLTWIRAAMIFMWRLRIGSMI